MNHNCRGKTKKGKPCGAAATDSGYCYFHANPEMVARLGQAGGRKNRHVVSDALRPLPQIDSISAVRTAVAQMIDDVYAKRLHPRTAAGLAPLFNTMLRILSAEEMERKVKELQKQVDELAGSAIASQESERNVYSNWEQTD